MNFAEPLWLLAGLIGCALLVWVWRRYDMRQRAALAAFASPRLHSQLTASFSTTGRNWKRGLFLAAVACLFAALARPQAGFRWEEVKRRGIEVIFCRGHFAQHADARCQAGPPHPRQARGGRFRQPPGRGWRRPDRLCGNAFLQCPITLDYDAFHESLAALDTTIIPRAARTSPARSMRPRPRCKTARAPIGSSSC